MDGQGEVERIEEKRRQWEDGALRSSLDRCGASESPYRFCTPADLRNYDFLEKVGFPGEYPFTANTFATSLLEARNSRIVRERYYAGYATAEDTRDYYTTVRSIGIVPAHEGPYLAFDLPTQCGYDSDDPPARGEVGRVGVAVDSLKDMEVVFGAFTGENDLDKIVSELVINAPAIVIFCMYLALAEQRGIALHKLPVGLQNDILKEYIARGLYIYPPKPSLRMVRDIIVFCTKNMPLAQPINIWGAHMREAGATIPQTLGFTFSNAIAYVETAIDAGVDVDDFAPHLTFGHFAGSIEFFQEIAMQRAARRMWAKIMKERFGAKDPRSWQKRDYHGVTMRFADTTKQRPLNNLTRSVVAAMASIFSGGNGEAKPPFDEPLGLGHSLEARQLKRDAERILKYEAKLDQVIDPFAGSYFMEALTDQIEAESWRIIEKVDALGGAIAAIESGYVKQEITRSAYEFQKQLETGERVLVGVNTFVGEHELEVTIKRSVPGLYSRRKLRLAENKQIRNLKKVKSERDNQKVERVLKDLQEAARDEDTNLVPATLEAVKAYATEGEMCRTLKAVFGEYKEGYGL